MGDAEMREVRRGEGSGRHGHLPGYLGPLTYDSVAYTLARIKPFE
jgi:hypothetical protein